MHRNDQSSHFCSALLAAVTLAVTLPATVLGAELQIPPVPDPVAARAAAPSTGPPLDMLMEADPEATLARPELMCGTTRAHMEHDASLRLRRKGLSALAAAGQRSNLRPLPKTYKQNGIVVIEDNGTVLRNDNVYDLSGTSVRFVPAGLDFTMTTEPLSYDPALGTLVIDDVRAWAEYQHSLGFSFPFGGSSYSEVWLATNLGAYFEVPTAPSANQLLPGNVLFDRTPRVGPMIMGRSLRGYSVWVREDVDRLLVTWQGPGLDVQLTLYASGDILMSYQAFPVEWGAPTVVHGNPLWWADLRSVGSQADPLGDTSEDPSLDIVDMTLRQVGTSELFYYELTLAGPVPVTSDTLYWEIVVFRTPTDPSPITYYIYYVDGNVSWNNVSQPSVSGSTVTFGVASPADELPVRANANTWINQGGWRYADGAALDAVTITAADPTMIDIDTVATPYATTGPVFEAFTIPELLPYEVLRVMRAEFGDIEWDSVSIFQNLNTDIIFYAGGYSTVGNAGADGIGTGNSADPVAPALLHMNRIRAGWNTSRQNRTLLINQEFGHHWLYFARIDDGFGSPTDIVNPDGAHYAGWVHTPAVQPVFNADDASSLGGAWWTDNLDGSFTASDLRCFGFNWVDLYLMGFADPAEVDPSGEWWYIADPVPAPASAYWPSPGFVVDSGVKTPLSIDQIIDNHGPRFPAYPDTKLTMQVPYVLVTREGAPVPTADVDEVALYCAEWVEDWVTSTYSRSNALCNATFNQAPNGIVLTPVGDLTIGTGDSVDFTGDWLDPDGDDVTWLWTFDGVEPDSVLQNPGLVTFDVEGVYEVCLTVTDLPGLTDPEPACVSVTVGCSDPPTVGGTLRMAAANSGSSVLSMWGNLIGITDYPIFDSLVKAGPFTNEVTAGVDGTLGTLFAAPTVPRTFYRIAGREGACLGSVDD